MSNDKVSDVLPGDRSVIGEAESAKAKRAKANAKQIAGVAGIVVAGCGVFYLSMRTPVVAPPPIAKAAAPVTRTLELPGQDMPRFNVMMPLPQETRAAAAVQPVKADPTVEEQMLLAAQRAPVTAYHKNRNQDFRDAKDAGGDTNGSSTRETDDKGAFERRFTPSTFRPVSAGMVSDRRFLLLQGTDIPCVLENAMQSDIPGFATCIITRDVLSANGQVVLMERGTKVFGEYRGGLTAGVSRLNVIWARAVTPIGVDVPLGAAATDGLGRAGIGGTVDTHFFERFGAALLLSVVQDGSQIVSSQIQQSGGGQHSAQSGNTAAAMAVEQSAQIKPTLKVNQGVMVSIKVTRDVDFSKVYRLLQVRDTGAWSAGANFGVAESSATAGRASSRDGGSSTPNSWAPLK